MSKTVFTFGRMNPPTIGHQKLVDKVKAEAKKQGAMPHVYLSHTQNAKKDPLDYNTKIRFARKAFGPSVTKSASKTIIQVLQELEKMGHTEATLVVGSDRVGEFKTFLNKYNGKDFTFKKLSVVSAGQRDPDAEGTAGMSATKIRGLAQAGELEEFGKGLPSTFKSNDTKAIYNKVRKVMGITESVEIEDKDFEFTEQELDAFIEMTDLEGLDEQTDIDEDFETLIEEIELSERVPLTVPQRLAIGRRMKRLAPKMKRRREIQKKKMADKPRLENRARKAAIKLLRTKFAGKQGANYASLSPGAKISVDRIIQKKMSMVKTISKRMLPKVRKAEMDRLKAARSSKKVVGTANESFDMQFESYIAVDIILEDEDKQTNQKLLYMLRQAFTDATERQLVIRALKGGEKSLQNPKLRPFILKLLNRLLDATQSDPTMFVKMKDRLRRMSQDDSKKETDESVKVVESFKTKSAKSGIPLDIIFECFLREEDSSRGFDRVNSFIAGGKAWKIDSDLVEKIEKKASGDLKDACWKDYKAIGTKKKNGKIVPNCVPEEVELDEAKTHFVYQKNVDKTKTIVHRGDEKSSREWISKNSKHYDHEGKNFVIYKGKPGNVSLRDVVEEKSIDRDFALYVEETHKGVDIGDWKYDSPKDFVIKLIDKFGTPNYIEKNPTTGEAYSVTFMDIDGFDFVRIVDSNTNKLHPYPAKIFVEGGMYFKVPHEMVGKLKEASPTIMIDELNGWVVGKCASLTIAAATVQFVMDAVNGNAPPTREEYDKRIERIMKKGKADISWWENGLNEAKKSPPLVVGKRPIFDPKSTEFRNVSKKQKKLDQTSNEDVDAAKDKIAREKEADKVKHDTMLDRARTSETQAKNRSTNESIDDAFTAFLNEEGGAGEWGTSKLKKKYSKDTPYAEETYDGDKFDEAYGTLWFNEDEELDEAEYQGNKVTLGKPSAGDVKKFKVYVKNEKGNVVKVNFGDPNMTIKKHIPARRKSFRARHNCDNPGPRTSARYWSCKNW